MAIPSTGTTIRDGGFVDVDAIQAMTLVPGLDFQPVLGQSMLLNFASYEPHTEAPTPLPRGRTTSSTRPLHRGLAPLGHHAAQVDVGFTPGIGDSPGNRLPETRH